MFVLSKEKLFELDQLQNQEFLFDLIYEIIKENPALKLNNQFDQLVFPVQSLINQYLGKGFNQIDTIKYMVKSHVYLGFDYEDNILFSWVKSEMEDFSVNEQVGYVNKFYEILEEYKVKVVGENFEYMIEAINNLKNVKYKENEFLVKIYPQKVNYLIEKNQLYDDIYNDYNFFVFGVTVENNFFIKNIC